MTASYIANVVTHMPSTFYCQNQTIESVASVTPFISAFTFTRRCGECPITSTSTCYITSIVSDVVAVHGLSFQVLKLHYSDRWPKLPCGGRTSRTRCIAYSEVRCKVTVTQLDGCIAVSRSHILNFNCACKSKIKITWVESLILEMTYSCFIRCEENIPCKYAKWSCIGVVTRLFNNPISVP